MVVPGFVVNGIAALVIILAILALLVLGIVSFFRMIGRGARRIVESRGRREARRWRWVGCSS